MNQLILRIFLLLAGTILVLQQGRAQDTPDAIIKQEIPDSGITIPARIITIPDSAALIPMVVKPAKRIRDSASFRLIDSLKGMVKDTARAVPVYYRQPSDTSLQAFYRLNPYINAGAPSIFKNEEVFSPREKDTIFYVLAGLFLMLGLIRLVFAKYFNDLFRIFFQTTFRQKSIREQLLQNRMGSLVLNIFFCISGGLFLYFVSGYKGWLPQTSLIQKGLLCIALIATVYATKYITLKISGWLFGMPEVTETYLFIVFLINKVVGVLLLPAILLLALGTKELQPVLLVISLLVLSILYLYRYLIALPLVRNHSRMTGIHFFIYLCAFEVVPVLLIYKLLLLMLSR